MTEEAKAIPIKDKHWHVRHDNEIWTEGDEHVALADSEELATHLVRIQNDYLLMKDALDRHG